MTFYNRESELNALDTVFKSAGHDFVVVYGRPMLQRRRYSRRSVLAISSSILSRTRS